MQIPSESGDPPVVANRPSVRRDLFVVATITVVTFILSSVFEVNEALISLTRPLEKYQIDELPTTLLAMIVALAWFSWRRSRQATEQANLRLEAQTELASALAENRRLSQRYVQVQEEERRFLARELHDEFGQSLNAIKVDAVNIREASVGMAEIQRDAQAIIDVSSKVYEVVRTLLRQLRPVALDELGLASAVQHSVDEWQRRHKAIDCALSISGELEGLSEATNITAYRFVQECLTNVARHAEASEVRVMLRRTAHPQRLEMVVEDDGRGLDLRVAGRGLGLVGLRERIEALGGTLEFGEREGNGMRVTANVPLNGQVGS